VEDFNVSDAAHLFTLALAARRVRVERMLDPFDESVR
jgi:hypothetical protein